MKKLSTYQKNINTAMKHVCKAESCTGKLENLQGDSLYPNKVSYQKQLQ